MMISELTIAIQQPYFVYVINIYWILCEDLVPHLKCDKAELERVQRRTARIIRDMEQPPSNE